MSGNQSDSAVRSGMLDTAGGPNRRRAFRVDDTVDLSVRVLTRAQFDVEVRRLRHRHRNGGRGGDVAPPRPTDRTLLALKHARPEVYAWIEHLETNLGMVSGSRSLEPSDQEPIRPGRALAGLGSEVAVDLSEFGMGFPLVEPLEPGTRLAIELSLSSVEQPLELLGDIVRTVEREGRLSGSARFRDLDPDSTRTLVRHIFAVQREQLRRRRPG